MKLEAPSNCLERLRAHPQFRDKLKHPADEQQLDSVYFDSDDLYLREHGLHLRVRRMGDRHLQTLKIAGPASTSHFDRTEIEAEVPGDTPNFDMAAEQCHDLPPIADDIRNAIKPIFTTHVERKSFRIDENESEIELALDSGRIVANGSAMPISEIELELKRGRPADLFSLARSISAIVPVQLALESKADRGYELLQHPQVQASKAEPVILLPSTSVGDAFKAIAHSCLRQIVGNSTAVRARNPAAVHQMRVGMRRLRAAMSIFSEVVRDDQVDRVKERLKHYAAALGPARDLEITITDVLRPFSRRHPKDKGFAALTRSFTRQRTKAYERAIQAVSSDEFRTFTIDCAAWIEAGNWTAGADQDLARPINLYAAHQIARRRKKLLRRGRHLVGLEPAEVHKLRIQAKKVRYAVEFFRSLYDEGKKSKRWRRFVGEMHQLQEALGCYNDMMVRRKLFIEFTAGPQAKKNPAIAFAAGQIVGEQRGLEEQLLKNAAKALSKLQRVKAFWKVEETELEMQAEQSARLEQTQGALESSETPQQPDAA